METLLILAIAVLLVLFVAPAFPWLPIAGCAYLLGLLWVGVKTVAKRTP